MKRLNALWNRLPSLPRGWRVVRNLAVSALVILAALLVLEWPSLSFDGAFQRLEGAYLLTPSQVVLKVGKASQKNISYLVEGEGWIAVGTTEKYSDADNPLNLDKFWTVLHQVLPKEGIQVVPIPTRTEEGGLIVAVWGAPEGASGTMELDLMGLDDPIEKREVAGLETFTAQGEREGEWLFFHFLPHDNHPALQACAMDMVLFWGSSIQSVDQYPYRLRLTDGEGTPEVLSGTLPKDWRLIQR